MTTVAIITFSILTILSFTGYGLPLLFKAWAEVNKFFTKLIPETGKLVGKEENVINILFNSKDGHYDKNGEWQEGKQQDLGKFFKKFGIAYFGFTPFCEILKFKVYENNEEFKMETSFKRFYYVDIEMNEVEMLGGKIKIDLKLRFRFKVLNIIKLLYYTKPDGINLNLAIPDIKTAVANFVKDKEWDAFEKSNKTDKDSDFIKMITDAINKITKETLGIEIDSMQLSDYGMTKDKINEEVQQSLVLNDIARNKAAAKDTEAHADGKALLTVAQYKKRAHALEIGNEVHRFSKMGKVAKENPEIIPYMNLEQLKGTQLRVLGNNVMPTINIDDGETKKEDK